MSILSVFITIEKHIIDLSEVSSEYSSSSDDDSIAPVEDTIQHVTQQIEPQDDQSQHSDEEANEEVFLQQLVQHDHADHVMALCMI